MNDKFKIGIGVCVLVAILLYVMYRKKQSEEAEREAIIRRLQPDEPEAPETEPEPESKEEVPFSTDLLNKIPKLPFFYEKQIQVLDKGIFEISDSEKSLVVVPSLDWQSYIIQDKTYAIDDRESILKAIATFFGDDNSETPSDAKL